MNSFSSNMLLINNKEIASSRSSSTTQTKIQIRQLAGIKITERLELGETFKDRSRS